MKVEIENRAVVAAVAFFAIGGIGGWLLFLQPIVRTSGGWSAVGSLLSGIGGIAAASAAVVLAMVGRAGLSTWREQETGKKRYLLACDTLAKVYELAAAYQSALHPFVSMAEIGQIPRFKNESKADYDRRAPIFVIWERLKEVSIQESGLRSIAFQAKAVLGDQVDSALQDLLMTSASINTAATDYYLASNEFATWSKAYSSGGNLPPQFFDAQTRLLECQNKLYNISDAGSIHGKLAGRVGRCEGLLRAELSKFDQQSNH